MAAGVPGAAGILSSGRRGQISDRSSATSKKKVQPGVRAATGRRPTPSPRRRAELPVLPIAVALVLLAVAAGFFILYRMSPSAGASGGPVDGITCDTGEHVRTGDHHYHAHLTILYKGTEAAVEANVGIPSDGSCIYWLHTHDTTGVIHIEAPADRDKGFTLGQFFDLWHKPLSAGQVADLKPDPGGALVAYVDGQRYSGNPRGIVLKAHEQIVLEITPPAVEPPPTYTFAPNL